MLQNNSLRDKLRIGVMGSASGPLIEDPDVLRRSYELGRSIAKQNCILVNGACPGLPDEAAKGAKSEGGIVIGISPAFSKAEHVKEYLSPLTADFILYTGMGFMERDIINIRTADGIIIVGGGVGSLNEFTIAYDEERPIGVLAGTKGISGSIHDILQICHREFTPNIFIEENPDILVKKLLTYIKTHPGPIHEDSRVKDLKIKG
jgi:hypothetical protein